MKITLEGTLEPIELSDDEFVHAGGEGSVYVKGDTAYKIYHDQKKMIELGRLLELQKIDCPNVIKPEKTIYNMAGKAVGYSMKALNDVWALTRLFNKSFRRKHGVTDEVVITLVQRMRDTYARLHQLGFLVTDGNELNFLVAQDFSDIYFIDVDAFSTPSYGSRAYNEATLDPNLTPPNLDFTQESDWFAFGVVACQMLTGIHPFKGIYEGTRFSFAKNDIPERIKKRISYFNNEVRLARPIMPLNALPDAYLAWFKETFETVTRNAPPAQFDGFTSSITQVSKVVSKALNIALKQTLDEDVISVYTNGIQVAYKTKSKFIIDGNEYSYSDPKSEMVFLPRSNTPLLVKQSSKNLVLYNPVTKHIQAEPLDLMELLVFDNRIYGICGKAFVEITFIETKSGYRVFSDILEDSTANTTKSYDGLVIENLMGGTHATLPIKEGECAKIHLSEYDKRPIINAKYSKNIFVIVWYDKGNYIKDTFKLDKLHRQMKKVSSTIVDSPDINIAVLENGVAISMEEDGRIKIFSNHFKQDELSVIKDKTSDNDLRVFPVGNTLNALLDKNIYELSMS